MRKYRISVMNLKGRGYRGLHFAVRKQPKRVRRAPRASEDARVATACRYSLKAASSRICHAMAGFSA